MKGWETVSLAMSYKGDYSGKVKGPVPALELDP